MGYLHSGLGGKETRSKDQIEREWLQNEVRKAKEKLDEWETRLADFEKKMERKKYAKRQLSIYPPTEEELAEFLELRRKEASSFIDSSHPEWPKASDPTNDDKFLRLIRKK